LKGLVDLLYFVAVVGVSINGVVIEIVEVDADLVPVGCSLDVIVIVLLTESVFFAVPEILDMIVSVIVDLFIGLSDVERTHFFLVKMPSLYLERSLIIAFFIIFLLRNVNANNTATTVQLRKSVQFSYAGADLFLDLIRGNASQNEFVEILKVTTDSKNHEYPSIMLSPFFAYFPGYVGCLIFGVLFATLVPMVGIFFCCIRCCGRCGGRLAPMDRKADPYRRVCYTTTLALLVTIQLAAIVLCFINYQLFYESLTSKELSIGFAPQLELSSREFRYGITEVVNAAKNSSSVDLVAQKQRFDEVFDVGISDFQRDFVDNSSAAAVMKEKEALEQVVYRFATGSPDSNAMKDFIMLLEKTEAELPYIQKTISGILNTECTVDQLSACRELRFTTDNDLKVAYTLDEFQTKDVTAFLQILENAQDKVRELDEFNAPLLKMKENVKKAIQPILDDAWNDLSNSPKTREDLVKTLEAVADSMKSWLSQINEVFYNYTTSDKPLIEGGNEIILYSGFAFLCLPAFIILLFYLGLSFGVCGDRPHEEASFCNRGVGANFLLSGIVFTFLFSTLLMIVCTVIFLSAGLAQTEFCRYVTHRYPDGPAVLDDLLVSIRTFSTRNSTVDYVNVASARPFSTLLTRCANESLVDSLGDEVVGMMVPDNSINSFLESILKTFNEVDLISPLRKTAVDTLNKLTEVRDLQRYDFSQALQQTNERLTEILDFNAYITQLKNLKIENLKDPIASLQETVGLLSTRMDSGIRQLYADLHSIHGTYNQLAEELNSFSSELDRTVPTSIRTQIESMRPLFLKELRLAVIASWRDIPCTRLHSAATSVVNTGCHTLLDPPNGIWFGLGIFLVLCIPVLIFGVKSVNLYRKTEKYSPDYNQPDYISYHAFYMRPATSEGDTSSRKKRRPRKPKTSDRPHSKGDDGSGYGFSHRHGPASNSTYQTVSVYPYDAYE
uniref:Prominin-like protein n=1 Tax=Rodentolepis nana TaxID=102285 RepID=A0A158QIW0_RODNA